MKKSGKKRRNFTGEFKEQAVSLVIDRGLTRAQVARDLGVSPMQVGSWVKEFQSHGSDAFPGKGNLTPTERRIKDLEEQLKTVKMERDLLKKATAYFAALKK